MGSISDSLSLSLDNDGHYTDHKLPILSVRIGWGASDLAASVPVVAELFYEIYGAQTVTKQVDEMSHLDHASRAADTSRYRNIQTVTDVAQQEPRPDKKWQMLVS